MAPPEPRSPGRPSEEQPDWFRRALRTPVVPGVSRAPDGRRLAWRRWGSGPQIVVLVHGGAAHAGWWDHVAPLLLDSTTTVVACDLAGHGDSEGRPTYQLGTWADDVVRLALDPGVVGTGAVGAGVVGIGARTPVLVGHSMGGQVVWEAASRHGDRLLGAVMIDANIGGPFYVRTLPVRSVKPHRVYPSRAAIVGRFRTLPAQEGVPPYILAHVAETSIRRTSRGWQWKYDPEILRRPLWTDAIPSPTGCRLALLRAEHGIVRPPTLDFLHHTVRPDVEVVDLPGAFHHVMLDQPRELAEALRLLVRRWSAADAGGGPSECPSGQRTTVDHLHGARDESARR